MSKPAPLTRSKSNGKETPTRTSAGGARRPGGGKGITSDRQSAFTLPGLSASDGERVTKVLQRRLLSVVDLSLTLKHVHWNVVGPNFVAVHQMLDPQYKGVAKMVDALAERIAALGGVPSGLPGQLVANRTWDDYSLGRADAMAHLGALDLVYNNVIADHRQAMDEVGEIDRVSEDLLIGQTSTLEKYQWFIRSHLADWAGGRANAGASTELGAAESVLAKETRGRRRSGAMPASKAGSGSSSRRSA